MPQIFAYLRKEQHQNILVICNYEKAEYELNSDFIPSHAKLLLKNYDDDLNTHLRAYETKIYYYED